MKSPENIALNFIIIVLNFFFYDIIENFFKDFKVGDYTKYAATASIGCAVFPREGADFETLYKAADQALYQAKQRGKNQLAFYKEPEGFGQSV